MFDDTITKPPNKEAFSTSNRDKSARTDPESRKESGWHVKEIQRHPVLGRKERDEKPCNKLKDWADMFQTIRNHSSKQTREAFNQSEELSQGPVHPIKAQSRVNQSKTIPEGWHQLTSLKANEKMDTIKWLIIECSISEDDQWRDTREEVLPKTGVVYICV